MKKNPTQEGFEYSGKDINVGIVFAEFNAEIGSELLKETLEELKKLKTKNIQLVTVPGALEIPIAAQRLVRKDTFDVIIALGTIIKGETSHYEHVSRETTHGLAQLSLVSETPIIQGVLTVLNEEQARDRIFRGKEYARAAIQIVHTLKNI